MEYASRALGAQFSLDSQLKSGGILKPLHDQVVEGRLHCFNQPPRRPHPMTSERLSSRPSKPIVADYFRCDAIGITRVDPDGGEEVIIERGSSFVLPRAGVYVLSGDNQSGKSSVVKFLMGAMPPRLTVARGKHLKDNKPVAYFNGEKKDVSSVRDAYKAGMAAVFQDDALIPTMTIEEQALLRWTTIQIGEVAAIAAPLFAKTTITPIDDVGVKSFIDRFWKRDSKSAGAWQARLQANIGLFGDEFSGIVSRRPAELSGGARAVARIALALHSDDIRVLFLDEALAGIQRTMLPKIIENLKTWQARKNSAIVAVTHNHEEVSLWAPQYMHTIKDRRISVDAESNFGWFQSGIPQRFRSYTVYTSLADVDLDSILGRYMTDKQARIVVIQDDAIPVGEHALLKLQATLQAHYAGRIHTMSVKGGEEMKSFAAYQRFSQELLSHMPTPNGVFVIVGGGTVLNCLGFAASTVYRGAIPMMLFPSTLMAMADVAVGSKTGINVGALPGEVPRKHAIGNFANPCAVVMERAFLSTLPIQEKCWGLAECLKHGVAGVGMSDLEANVLNELEQDIPRDEKCFELAVATAKHKASLLTIDPWEKKEARDVLLFGHIHAHAIERASRYSLPHGFAVLIGIAADLQLLHLEEESTYRRLIYIIRRVAGRFDLLARLREVDQAILEQSYALDIHCLGDEYTLTSRSGSCNVSKSQAISAVCTVIGSVGAREV